VKSLTVTSGRHPFEILMLVAAFIAGVAYILRLGGTGTPERLIPGSAVWAWYLCLAVGAGVALIGAYLPQATIVGLYKSLIVERMGLFLLGASCALYEVALIAFSSHTPGTLAVIGGFASACLFRFVQAVRDVRRLAAEIGGHDAGS
jgi:hypothetical protein